MSLNFLKRWGGTLNSQSNPPAPFSPPPSPPSYPKFHCCFPSIEKDSQLFGFQCITTHPYGLVLPLLVCFNFQQSCQPLEKSFYHLCIFLNIQMKIKCVILHEFASLISLIPALFHSPFAPGEWFVLCRHAEKDVVYICLWTGYFQKQYNHSHRCVFWFHLTLTCM